MLAAVLHGPDDLRLADVPVPEPAVGEVVISIKSCGFCATDYKAIKGIRTNVDFPTIPGHEPSGIISATGAGVRQLKEGDEVIIQPSGFCGVCEYCRAGLTHYCVQAFTTGGDGPDDVRNGAFAEYMVTDELAVFIKPSNISFDAAALTEPLSGAWKGVIQHSEMNLADDVVVIGTGSIGLLCLMVAKAAGAGRLIAVDVSATALENARRLGATHTVNPEHVAAVDAISEILPAGPDLVVEAAGPIEAVKLAASLRRRGTRWNVFGITTHETFELDGGLTHFLEGRMDASFGTTPRAMQQAIRLMERGLIDPEQIITHRFPLEKIHDAVSVMGSRDRNKIIVNP
ncbi:MAG: alcohol dehydrogenase catalytic domain-containing protein [Spirochaetales bacterium]|jgi:threonine dehydrogenase-like Zn-dependent dehydrogenase|nr:alcohol dehydrogenase catalytic domain-containing protein [Spirochaetales bacterium]